MIDLRKKYITTISAHHFNLNDSNTDDQAKLEQFLDNENCNTLCVVQSAGKLQFHNEVLSNTNRMIIFYKNRPSRIDENNVYDIVQVIVLQGAPTAALYHTLHNVFTPLLVQEGKKSNAININLQRQLTNFQSSLRSAAFVADNDNSVSEHNSLSVISTLEHEVEYWNVLSNSTKNNERISGNAFRDILKPLARDFSMLDALQLIEVEDALEGAHNVLDDLWRHDPPYPRHRMQHLMDLIASDVINCITRRFSDIDIWNKDFTSISDILEQSINVGKKWNSTCIHLTQLFWPNYSLHPWTGESYTPPSLVDLVKRLEEVLSLRALHRQLVQLLNQNELEDLRTVDMFKPFKDLSILQCGPYSESSWRTSVKQFEYLLQPAETRVAEKLKLQFAGVSNNTRQLLYEFRRYTELMNRPVVRKILLAERQNLISALSEYVRQLSTTTVSEKIFSRYDTPQIIIEINHVRMLESKTIIVQQTAEKLLNDLHGFEDLQILVNELLKDLKHQHSELFDSWTRELTMQINNKSLSLKETDPVVQFSSAQLMRVNYSPRLVTLVREYRQLTAMGYRIPSHIEQIAVHAKQFMKYAKALEQVANFHNTIGDRMIESQRPMMLSGALELSRLVQQQEVVSWGDVRSVEKYVENLRAAVNRLSRDNNLLASYNTQMKEKIAEVSDVDLIRHLQKWKDAAKYMRDIITNVEKQGFSNISSWRLDIDRLFASEFENQYRLTLKKVHLHLPEIYVDLVYRDSKLQFNPSEEKLNEKYRQQLKRFLELPKNFRGLSDITEGSVFSEIIERCKDLYEDVEKHTKELFERLHGVIEHWQSWTSLGTLDTTKLLSSQHWDINFRASKTFGQEVAKLPSTEERVGCFIVSLSSLRSDLESHNRSYWSQLLLSLQDSIAQDVVILQQYVNNSTAALTKQPLTMEQVGQAHSSHSDIMKQMPEMQKLFDEMVNKNNTLSIWTRERVDSVARLQAAWERLHSLIDNHQHLISKQVESFKNSIKTTCENLNTEIERFALHWDQFKPRPGSGQIATDSLKNLEQYLMTLREKKVQWGELLKQKESLESDCSNFGVVLPEFPLCEQVEVDIEKEEKIWLLFEEFNNDLEKLSKEEWIVFRKKSYRLEEFVVEWQKRLESSDVTALSTRLLQELQKYEDILPVLKYVRGEDFTEKHWIEVFTLLEITPKPLDILTLQDFLNVCDKLASYNKELQAICKRAASEVVVRQALSELDQWEVQTRFVLTQHVDCQHNTIMLIKDFKDILNKIGDNQCLLQSVKNSADYESFSERAGLWETRLADLDHYLSLLSQIQRKWVYLEPIFGSGTLRQERSRFDRLDRDFRHILKAVEKDTRVTSLARYPNIRSLLDTLQDQLTRCQNSLDDFLKEKRLKFPRFLFLGDEDLLEILGQSSREQVIQAHLKKLFAGIHSIKMDTTGQYIEAMCSLQGEIVPLSTSVHINCPVEDWLNNLVIQMQNTLKHLLIKCLADGQKIDGGADPLKYPSQILCLADSIVFTTRCEQAIKSAQLPPLLATYKNQLKNYSIVKLATQKETNMDSLNTVLLTAEDRESNVLNLKLKALMLDTIHHIDVIEELLNYNVTSLMDWYWQKQLRFYSNNDGSIKIRMANAEMNYSYEYLGNESKLVRTPLTDKCFLTLTQGMHLGMGGNPYGPAGTGKTESVKALGALLGRQVLVFNCDEGVDATSMGQILSGLVQSGAWGCFDEFNRLDEATLSAVSMFIQPIQIALQTGKPKLTILQREININLHCGIFVTLNPAGGGYLGRNRLPDNLKQLFRPVVMSHPDHEQIAKTLLQCDGFQHADVIGRKLVELFTISNELLSKQLHYDWGLRSLKTVVNSCGSSLNKYHQLQNESNDNTLQQEIELVVQSLRVNTLSKLTYSDSTRFDSLVRDVFIGTPFVTTGLENLSNCLEESIVELGLQINTRQIAKCIELFEQLQQRMGVTIVGPSGSGKTTLRKLLLHALQKMNYTITQHVFNPKAIPRTQLLGYVDLDTRQWTDGVLTTCAHQVYSEPADVWSWIVCDGDVDPEWVESLNSVLDDNRLLTLPSGWRIQFGPNVNFIFETHDLSYASPATISRMGIVFMSEEDLNLNDLVTNWLEKQPKENIQISSYLINEYFFKAVNWIKTEGDLSIPCPSVAIVQTGLVQLTKVSSKSHFTVALIAGLGGLLTRSSAEIFAQKVFEWTGEHCPDENNILKCYYNLERDLIDVHYSDTNCQISNKNNMYELPLILTGQIVQTLDIIRPWLSEGTETHFLLIGPHGSGKSLILDYIVKEQHDIDLATIYCSASIVPQYILYKLSEHCMIVNSNRGRVYRPKKGRLVLYFKGLHLVKNDQWNTNMLVAFLHQLITYGGFYDNNLEWVGLENVTIVATLSSTNNLSSRFISLMKIHNIDLPDKDDLNIIYETYLSSIIKLSLPNSPWLVKSKISNLITTIISIYEEVQDNFTVLQYQHYTFSPHVLTKWCTSIARYKTLTEMSDSENGLLEVICYEARRLFSDRLVNEDDRNKFESIMSKILQLKWGKSVIIHNIKGVYHIPTDGYNNKTDVIPLIRLNTEDWISMVQKGISYFGREGQTMDLLIIPELLFLTSLISKAMTEPAGSILLAGRSGVGRRSALRIVSTLQGARLITPASGTLAQFKLDLKSAMQISGVDGEHVYFLIEDHMICNNEILKIVNTLLAAGEVPGLYTSAEFDSLSAGLKDDADRDDFVGNVNQYFNHRIRNNLHLAICLEIDNSIFWSTLENSPAFYQKCTVIWQSEWSSETMRDIPNLLLRKISENKSEDRVNLELPNDFYTIHKNIKESLATPRRYMSFIDTYINLYSEKTNIIYQRQSKLQAGVTKLNEAKKVVAELKVQAMKQQENLAEKQSKANSALDMISATMQNANVHKQEMKTLKEKTEKENQQLLKRKKEIELELAEVEPILQEARSAVGNIKTEALSEIRSLRAPPDIIRDILEGVLRLMGTQDTSWNSMKTFLSKRGVKEDIRSFDAARISPENRQAVERLLSTNSDSFDPKAAKRASVAAAPLASWVIANVRYSTVVEKIRPLEREQYRLQQNLKLAENQIVELSAGLTDVDAKVAQLKTQLSTYTKEAAEIEINLKAAEEKLNSAEGLVSKLNEEYERWGKQNEEFSMELKTLPIKCLLTASFITYLSEEFEDERRSFLEKWGKTLLGEDYNFTFEEFLCTEREQFHWLSEGLLSDKLSIQNAAIILKSKNRVLLLDPSSIALKWLQKHLKHRNVEVITPTAPRFNTSLELAMRFGKILIINDVENIPDVLLPILRNEFIFQGERKLVLLGNKLVDYHHDFSLYLSSRNALLKIPADAYAVLSIVNFTTTRTGLTEQLLSAAIHQEYPQLQAQKSDLLQKQEDLQEQQYTLQNRLLEELANASGDILQNKQLLLSLNEMKASSIEITSALQNLKIVQLKLQTEYDVFRPLSIFGSELYFATKELIKINVMYSISITAFIRLFIKALSSVNNAQTELIQTQKILFQSVYSYISRGMLKSDRLLFLLHLCQQMYPKEIKNEEWKLFLGRSKSNEKSELSNSIELPSWISPQCAPAVKNFQNSFPDLYNSLKLDEYSHWEKFSRVRECELSFPKFLALTSFQQLLIVQMLRPDRLHTVMCQCVLHITNMKTLSPGNLYLSQVLKETINYEPILIINGPGADPSLELRDLAIMVVGNDKYIEISMGEGQETSALKALDDASRLGQWICLKNLHLVTSWLPELSQKIQTLTLHEEFRLWLVTEPHAHFSNVLIQACLKIAYETPQGIKNNLLRSYTTWENKYIQKQTGSGARLLFVLAYIHALLQERRTYIPQGWSKWYEFSDLDLYTAANLAEQMLNLKSGTLLWDHMRGLCGDAIYGGRIDEKQDERILISYLKNYFNDSVLGQKWKPLGMNHLPINSNFQEYLASIKQLPDTDNPLCFGLPPNIDRAWQKNMSNKIITSLITLHFSKNKHDGVEKNIIFNNVTPILVFWRKLNKNQEFLHMSITKSSNETQPLIRFINDEKIFSLKLIQLIHKSLSSINRVSRGTALPTKQDVQIANSLFAYKTPSEWLNLWNGPTEPFKYLQALVNKTAAISKWDVNMKIDELFKEPINLSVLFHPNTFLAALKQHTSRISLVPMDNLKVANIWNGRVNSRHSITLTGLLIEGVIFDGRNLTKCLEDSDSISPAPNCSFAWIPKDEVYESEDILKVPLYYSSSREKQITMMNLISNKKDNDEWLLSGIALFLEY